MSSIVDIILLKLKDPLPPGFNLKSYSFGNADIALRKPSSVFADKSSSLVLAYKRSDVRTQPQPYSPFSDHHLHFESMPDCFVGVG
jgi:hypothetical protein